MNPTMSINSSEYVVDMTYMHPVCNIPNVFMLSCSLPVLEQDSKMLANRNLHWVKSRNNLKLVAHRAIIQKRKKN